MDLTLVVAYQEGAGLEWTWDVQPNTADNIQANIRLAEGL